MTPQKKYCNELWRQLSLPSSEKKTFFLGLEQKVNEYCEQNLSATYEDIVREFGKPRDLISLYLATFDMSEINNKLKGKRKLWLAVTLVLILTGTSLVAIFTYESLSKKQDGYFVEQVVDLGETSSSLEVDEHILSEEALS